jgi:hypothetical protein
VRDVDEAVLHAQAATDLSAKPPYCPRPPPAAAGQRQGGTTLVFQVDLVNPENRPVALSPCPVYVESSDIPTELEHRLNCLSVRSVPATARCATRWRWQYGSPPCSARHTCLGFSSDLPLNSAAGRLQVRYILTCTERLANKDSAADMRKRARTFRLAFIWTGTASAPRLVPFCPMSVQRIFCRISGSRSVYRV